MSDRPVPTAEQLKQAALEADSLDTLLMFVTSDVIILHALLYSGQAAGALREQVEKLTGSRDPMDVAILEAHAAAESLLERCAEAAHMVCKGLYEQQQRKNAARYN